MELSPPSSNVGYFILYPEAWWDENPYLGTSQALTRAQAADMAANPAAVATADVYGFDWSYDPQNGQETGGCTWTNFTPYFFPHEDQGPSLDVQCLWTAPPFACYGSGFSWVSAYAGGGTNTPFDVGGGVNALLVEITADDPTRFVPYGDEDVKDYELTAHASSDGGQSFTIYSIGDYGEVPPLEDVLTRIKVWRLPTRIWPAPVEPPEAFWTRFVGSHEVK